MRGAKPDPRRRPTPQTADLPGRLLSGFGSPEGNVPAGRGVLWQDTDPNGDGKVYRKTTASGKTGWVETSGGGGPVISCRASWYENPYSNNGGDGAFLDSTLAGQRLFPYFGDLKDNTGGFELVTAPSVGGAHLHAIQVPESRIYQMFFRSEFHLTFSSPVKHVAHQDCFRQENGSGLSVENIDCWFFEPGFGSSETKAISIAYSATIALEAGRRIFFQTDVYGYSDLAAQTHQSPTDSVGGVSESWFWDEAGINGTELVVIGLAPSDGAN